MKSRSLRVQRKLTFVRSWQRAPQRAAACESQNWDSQWTGGVTVSRNSVTATDRDRRQHQSTCIDYPNLCVWSAFVIRKVVEDSRGRGSCSVGHRSYCFDLLNRLAHHLIAPSVLSSCCFPLCHIMPAKVTGVRQGTQALLSTTKLTPAKCKKLRSTERGSKHQSKLNVSSLCTHAASPILQGLGNVDPSSLQTMQCSSCCNNPLTHWTTPNGNQTTTLRLQVS